MAEGSLTMFGKTYNTVGSASDNLLLQTRGDIKIRWGNKFIDLIKNGKVNADVDFLKKVDSVDNIVTDGIYLIEDGETSQVWLSIGGKQINLVGEVNNDYVSFIKEQTVEVDSKFMALSNIGFFYESLEKVKEAKVQKGLVFILDSNKLYYIKEGEAYEYTYDFKIPNPLSIGSITIDGNTSSIQAGNTLQLRLGTADYISLLSDGVHIKNALTLDQDLLSSNYKQKVSGYSIYYDNDKDWSCAEFDYILVRHFIDYTNVEDIRYDDLRKLISVGQLIPDRKYCIIDFQNEWDVFGPQVKNDGRMEVYENNTTVQKILPKNIHPIVVIARDKKSLLPDGYFLENPNWKIQYDVNFYYYVGDYFDGKTTYRRYTKGRITRLIDEYGNESNFDFKHRKFKHTSLSDDINQWYFMYNAPNPDLGLITEKPYSQQNVSTYIDASLSGAITNNVIYIKEPKIVDDTYVYDENYIIFDNYISSNNTIKQSTGRYVITTGFYGNTINALLQKEPLIDPFAFNFTFYNNEIDTLYLTGTPLTESDIPTSTPQAKVSFDSQKVYHDNVFGSLENCELFGSIIYCKMGDMVNTAISADISYTLFYYETVKTYSHIKECIITENISNSTFQGDLEYVKVDGEIMNCSFFSLKGTALQYMEFKDSMRSMTVLDNLTPSSAQYVEGQDQPIDYLRFDITLIPKLESTAQKECYLQTKNNVVYFIVKRIFDDTSPRGAIIMFNGLIEDIPEGWAICNGENGTPDLRGRFIRSVVSNGSNGLDLNDRGAHDNPDLTKPDNGRKTSIVIDSDNLPAHLHKYKGTSKASGDTEDTAIQIPSISTTSVEVTPGTGQTLTTISSVDSTSQSHHHELDVKLTIKQDDDDFPNTPINVEPNSYALIFIMKL